MVTVDRIDHLVLTVSDLRKTLDFYTKVLGMKEISFMGNRKALQFGNQKINLHAAGAEFEPKAGKPVPGSADLCFIVAGSMEEVYSHLMDHSIPIIDGPVKRTGAMGELQSIYIRDPDGNLIELSVY